MRHAPALVLLLPLVSACAGTHRASCERSFPSCDRAASRPTCQTLTPANPTVYVVDPALLVGRISPDELVAVLGPADAPDTETGRFSRLAADADAVWYYDASGLMDNRMRIGEEGLLAIRGCVALAQQTLVIYN